jgi:AcrR family transcriptional regulator
MQPTTLTHAARPRPPQRRSRVSPEQIADAALKIVDRDGVTALTMRRVAAAIDVGTMTLYGHFRSKEQLLDAVVDAAVGRGKLPALTGSWRDQVRALMRAANRNLAAHPALVQIRFAQPVLRPEALRFGEAGMGILRSAGFNSREAAHGFRLLFTYVFGFAGLSPTATLDDARREAAAAIAGLPAEEYPNLAENSAEFSEAIGGGAAFNYGLERILDGLESHLKARAT